MSLISIVIAAYNEEKHLRGCVDSILAQTMSDYEIVIVNDGSTDGTEELIDKIIEENPNNNIVKINKPNGGLASARNRALGTLSSKYVTFLDADDYYDKDYLKTLSEAAEKNDADMVCSGQYKITEEGKILNTIKFKIADDGKCYERRLNISGKLYKNEYIERWKIRFPEGKLYEDNSFNLQALFLSDKIEFLEYEGYYQVVHEGSITSKPIDADKLPFDEWDRVAGDVKLRHPAGVDEEMFDLTTLSFFTYFLMIRNRKREYLNNDAGDNNSSDIEKITNRLQEITNKHFYDMRKNRYLSFFSYPQIPIKQKFGVRLFCSFCRKNRLFGLVKLVYKVM